MLKYNGKNISAAGGESIRIVLDGSGSLAKKAAELEIAKRRPKPVLKAAPTPPVLVPPPSTTANLTPSSGPYARLAPLSSHSSDTPAQQSHQYPPPPHRPLPHVQAPIVSGYPTSIPSTISQPPHPAKLASQFPTQNQGIHPHRNTNTAQPSSHPFPPRRADPFPSTSSQLAEPPHGARYRQPNPVPPPSARPYGGSSAPSSAFSANPFDDAVPTASLRGTHLDSSRNEYKTALDRRDEPDGDHYVPNYSDDSGDEDEDDSGLGSFECVEPLQSSDETSRRLKSNRRPFVFVDRESLPVIGKKAPLLAEVRRHFEKFQVAEVRFCAPIDEWQAL